MELKDKNSLSMCHPFYNNDPALALKISYQEVKKKADEYYRNKKLTAQHPDPHCRRCVNFLDEYRCAVAACYPEEWRTSIASGFSWEYLANSGWIDPSGLTLDEAGMISRLQGIHDYWATASNRGNDALAAEMEILFQNTLYSM